jgi:hypothetical protein
MLQEIDLEDGKVSWLGGIVIDRSRAISICDEIVSDQEKLQHHIRVYRDNRLRNFLSKGQVEHFLVTSQDEEREVQLAFEDEFDSFGDWLSPIFAAQYSFVLAKMVEQKELRVVECLLDGRRWVRPAHEEFCFDPTRRIVARLIDSLEEMRRRSETEKLGPPQVKGALARGQLSKLLEMLPSHLGDELSRAFHLVREAYIDANNKHDDPELALAILDVARPLAMRSAQLRHTFDEDSRKLRELKAEAEQNYAKLIIFGKPLEITKAGAKFGDRFIRAQDVTSLRWGAMSNAGGISGMAKYVFVVGADRGPAIAADWTAKETKEQDDFFHQLTYAGLLYLMTPCIENLRRELDAGNRIRIGPAVATRYGLEIVIKGWLSDKSHIIAWPLIKTDLQYGILTFSDPSNRKASATMSMMDTDNAVTLHWLIKLRGKT